MDANFLFSCLRSSSSHAPTVSPSAFLIRPFVNSKRGFSRAYLPCPPKVFEKSQFLGGSLVFQQGRVVLGNEEKPQSRPFHTVRAVVKRRKEMPFDNVIQRDKKLKLVLKIRRILMTHPDRIMHLRDMGRYRRELGLTRKRRFIALLKRFPAVFDIVEEGVYSLQFRLTPEAEEIYLEEMRLRNEMEGELVLKLRKLLMMSFEKRILIEKIAHLKHDLGLPLEFGSTICERYPQYFKVVTTDRGSALELTHWDPELAISAAEIDEEENQARKIEEENLIINRPPKFKRVKLPRGLSVSKGEMRRIVQFREIPFVSPYSDFSDLKAGTPEKEKHACAVIHEILSLTIEKRTLVDHLTHFREEFRFSQQLRGMLIRHPDIFYVSLKGDRDSVFLREAYHDSNLVEKDKLLILKEKMRALVSVPRFGRRNSRKGSDHSGSGGEDSDGSSTPYDSQDEEDWSDDNDDKTSNEDDDDWSDNEDDELPPDFDDGGVLSFKRNRAVQKKESSIKNPVLPDGKPRERW